MEKNLLEKIFLDQQQDFKQPISDIERIVDTSSHINSTQLISIITGVRRCGKSTVLKKIRKELPENVNVSYASFEDPRLRSFTSEDFEHWYEIALMNSVHENCMHYIFFDEIQLVNGWESWVDYFAKRINTKIFVTGSNAILLSSEISTMLTGRHLDVNLTPLFLKELIKNHSLHSPEERSSARKIYEQYKIRGGFPKVYIDGTISLLNQYYDDIIERDILKRLQRTNPRYIIELGSILSSESTRLFNKTKVAELLGVKNQETVVKYTKSFIASYLFYELRNYSPSVRKQLRSLSKFYCVDHALARETGMQSPFDSGASLETMVFAELSRRFKSIFYWKSAKDYEVDFLVIDRRKPILGVQVSFTIKDKKTREREIRGLMAANEELGIKELIIVTDDESEYIKDENIRVMSFIEFALMDVI